MPRQQASARIRSRIEQAPDLNDTQTWATVTSAMTTADFMRSMRTAVDKWDSYNLRMLERMFTTREIADEYEYAGSENSRVSFGELSPQGLRDRLRERVADKVAALVTIREKLDLFEVVVDSAEPQPNAEKKEYSRRVFVVHGHDEAARESVARFLQILGLEPLILHELPSRSGTVIEKLSRYSDVGFAVVLLTPDDLGGAQVDASKNPSRMKPRARQNVLLELGYFIGKLGRERVCALKKGDVEVPSDFSGVVYVSMDDAQAWHVQLARELNDAGYEIDLNAALLRRGGR